MVNIVSSSLGNWDFQGGIGDYKKNGRVVFSILQISQSETTTNDNGSSTSSSTNTCYEGKIIEVYLIKKSKKKSLTLASKGIDTFAKINGTIGTNEDFYIESTVFKFSY